MYTVRNVCFEPFANKTSDWVDIALNQIRDSFFWGKPAIISTHRINYVSNMSIDHRDNSLLRLQELIKNILPKWPSVEYRSTDELINYIK